MLNDKIYWSDRVWHRLCDVVLENLIKCTTINHPQGIRHIQLQSAENAYLIETEWCIYASVNLLSLVEIMACRLVGASHYLNQWWNIVNLILWNTTQWHFNRNSCIFIQENAFEYVVYEIPAILSRPQCDIPQAYSQLCIIVIVILEVCEFRWHIWPYSSRFLHWCWDNIVFETESNYCNQR